MAVRIAIQIASFQKFKHQILPRPSPNFNVIGRAEYSIIKCKCFKKKEKPKKECVKAAELCPVKEPLWKKIFGKSEKDLKPEKECCKLLAEQQCEYPEFLDRMEGQAYRTYGTAYVILKEEPPIRERIPAPEDLLLAKMEADKNWASPEPKNNPMPPFTTAEKRMLDMQERHLHPLYAKYRVRKEPFGQKRFDPSEQPSQAKVLPPLAQKSGDFVIPEDLLPPETKSVLYNMPKRTYYVENKKVFFRDYKMMEKPKASGVFLNIRRSERSDMEKRAKLEPQKPSQPKRPCLKDRQITYLET